MVQRAMSAKDQKNEYQLQVLARHRLLLQEAINDIHSQKKCLWHKLQVTMLKVVSIPVD